MSESFEERERARWRKRLSVVYVVLTWLAIVASRLIR